MRIIQFIDTNDGTIIYPEEGVTAFGVTVLTNGKVIGEYFGAATHPTLADYDGSEGSWPFEATPPPTHRTDITYDEFNRQILTSDELLGVSNSTRPLVVDLYTCIKHRSFDIFDVSTDINAALAQMILDGTIDSDRRDEIKLGIAQP